MVCYQFYQLFYYIGIHYDFRSFSQFQHSKDKHSNEKSNKKFQQIKDE